MSGCRRVVRLLLAGLAGPVGRFCLRRIPLEAALREYENRYRNLAELSGEAIGVVRGNRVVFANTRAIEFLGFACTEHVIGKTLYDLVHPNYHATARENLRRAEQSRNVLRFEEKIIRLDGSVRDVEVATASCTDIEGPAIQIVLRDTTDQRRNKELLARKQAELTHAWRVAVVGERASSLAHELSQPLCSIQNNADTGVRILRSGRSEREEILSILGDITVQAGRAGEIIRQVKEFTRKSEPRRVRTEINEIVRNAVRFQRATIEQAGVRVEMRLSGRRPCILADRIQIEQVVCNLIQNALDAMDRNPTNLRRLCIETDLQQDNEIVVRVKDSGTGISAEDRAHIMKPFFTTKRKGLGMGLPICRSIIEDHGGRLWYCHNPDRGVTFCFALPLDLSAEVRANASDKPC
jgi:PAS domain S-box-containing protein